MSEISKENHEDLYQDIDDVGNHLEISNLRKENFELQNQVKNLIQEIEELKAQLVLTTEEKSQLELNILAVYNTGLREISRKEKENISLRGELDQLKRAAKATMGYK